jgi:HD-like signal output (HDOD) protein
LKNSKPTQWVILHAIGRVLINRVIEEKGFAIFWDEHQPIEEWERSAVGFDFVQAGAMLLEHWHFPSPTCGPIRWQLNSEKVVEPVSLLGALQFTRSLLALTGLEFENQGWQFPASYPYVQASGLTFEQAFQIMSKCRTDFRSIRQSIGLN